MIARLKARDNPFATQRVESLLAFEPEWLDTSWESLLADLAAHRFRAAIVGPHGSGKTSFIDALIPRLQRMGLPIRHYFLNDRITARPEPADDPETLVIVDGAERLGFREWQRLRMHPRLLITQHRSGRLPTLLHTRTTPAMLEAFATRLDPALALDFAALYRKHRGNLREALLECYDLAGQGGLK